MIVAAARGDRGERMGGGDRPGAQRRQGVGRGRSLSFDCPFDQWYFVALFPKLARNDAESSSFGLPGVC